LHLYEQMVLLRQFELAAQACYRRGEMPGFIHLYIGEEAVAVGVCAHLENPDWITSTHRGHGHVLAKGMPPRILMAELFAKATGCCGGRGGSMHLYDAAHGVFGTNGIVGGGIPHAVGAALSARIKGTRAIATAFFGDGAVNHGAFHESLNFAGAQQAGVLFVCENNLYATATPLRSVTRNPEIATRADAYGVPGVAVDGNDVLAVWQAAREAVARARRGDGPTLIEAKTYRVVGHHEGDPLTGVYRGQAELDAWKKRCPIDTFHQRLTSEFNVATRAELAEIDARVDAIIADAVEFARQSPAPDPSTFFTNCWSDAPAPAGADSPAPPITTGWLDAVRDGIAEEMRRDPHLLYLGEGIGERGGSFAHTKGLWQEFGAGRVIDTPISELGFTGAAIGASATGCRTIADLMFADFLFETGGQIPLQAAKLRYMSNGQMAAPVVLRAPCGAIKSAGPQHSGTYHAMWAHLPGLIVAMPSNPADAKGLLKTALRGQDPVLFLEPKALFSTKGLVPAGDHLVPFGVARLARTGDDITFVTVGRMVSLTLEAAELLAEEGVQCDVIDLRTIVPLDLETILQSVAKTGRLLVVDEGYAAFGLGAEIAAAVGEHAFDSLDAPVGRVQMEPVPHPFNPGLEAAVLPDPEKIVQAARNLLAGEAPQPRRLRANPVESRPVTAGDHAPVTTAAVATPSPEPMLPAGEHLILPHGDLTVSDAKVVNWRKQTGDSFVAGEIVAEVETDKAILEVEAPSDGRLEQITAPVGATVKMGGLLGIFVKN
jgi:2-oxoisovalerate dehydrogenase E1 component